jgi:hypothetical protein
MLIAHAIVLTIHLCYPMASSASKKTFGPSAEVRGCCIKPSNQRAKQTLHPAIVPLVES